MIDFLAIKDFVLIPDGDMEFVPGFNVITGESGAGKSILMSALSLLFGARCDKSSIRTGCDNALVSCGITIPEDLTPKVAAFFAEQDLPFEDGSITIKRKITASAVRNFVNDTPVSVKVLTELGAMLIDFHRANGQLVLLEPARQLELLDRFAGAGELLEKCATIFEKLVALRKSRAELEKSSIDDVEREELQKKIADIENLAPAPNEESELESRYRIVANAREVLQLCGRIGNMLSEGEGSIVDQLGEVHHAFGELSRFAGDESVEELTGFCDSIQENCAILARKVDDLAGQVELDQEALIALESRIHDIRSIKRRYKLNTEEELLALAEAARERLAQFGDVDRRRSELDRQEKEILKELDLVAGELSTLRRQAAEKLIAMVKENLYDIGFKDCRLQAVFSDAEISAKGKDHLEFFFSANPGEALLPLHKIVSSGELSRFMLALKCVLADADDIPTVVFDEIDMNIGGISAGKVGDKLHELAKNHQIISISHLAQVASRADAHFVVAKRSISGRTVSEVAKVVDPVPELGRMLGGGDSALRHASELYASLKGENI